LQICARFAAAPRSFLSNAGEPVADHLARLAARRDADNFHGDAVAHGALSVPDDRRRSRRAMCGCPGEIADQAVLEFDVNDGLAGFPHALAMAARADDGAGRRTVSARRLPTHHARFSRGKI
jgi:hypothetical protein